MAHDISRLLRDVNAGEPQAFDALVTLLYDELRRMAAGLMRGRIKGATLQPTALVNEAFLRLVQGKPRWESRAHFFGAAARAMRQVLMAQARAKAAQKRLGRTRRVTFDEIHVQCAEPETDLVALDAALAALAAVEPRLAQVMELRYFAGCSLLETAELTGRSLATVKRDWTYARAWLHERLAR